VKLRSRLALAGGTVVFSALAVVSAVLYPALASKLRAQTDQALVDAAAAAPLTIGQIKDKLTRDPNGPGFPTQPLDLGSSLLQVIPDVAEPGAGAGLAPVDERDQAVAVGAARPYFRELPYRGEWYRVYTAPLADAKGSGVGGGPLIRVARPVAEEAATLHRLVFMLVSLTAAGTLGATVAARLAAARVLRPVGRLTDTVEEVAQTRQLSAPVPHGGRDEIGRLSRSFAGMMAALDRSVQAQRHLVADASHELRTPLTSLTTNLELLAEGPDPQAPELVQAARRQAGELTALVNDLVELSRQDHVELHREPARLDLLTERVVTRAAARAPDLHFHTALAESEIHADPDAIERAIANLVDNAVKWSPPGGHIHLTVTPGRLTVTDQGPGIPAADLPHVFDRFYRSPAARALPGSGLGLAIVRQIAESHGGHVSAHPHTPGTQIRLTLPTAVAAAADT
jgi:two-component system, OmpR family, sensor histidine kinase MprB